MLVQCNITVDSFKSVDVADADNDDDNLLSLRVKSKEELVYGHISSALVCHAV